MEGTVDDCRVFRKPHAHGAGAGAGIQLAVVELILDFILKGSY